MFFPADPAGQLSFQITGRYDNLNFFFTKNTLLFLLLIGAPSNAQTDWLGLFEHPGATAVSLGNAYTAGNNDATAIAWNPARLPRVDRGQLMLSAQMATAVAAPLSYSGENLLKWSADVADHTALRFAGIVMPYSEGDDNTHIGIALVRYVQFPFETVHTVTAVNKIGNRWTTDRNGLNGAIIAAIGADIYRGISLGGSVTFMSGEETLSLKHEPLPEKITTYTETAEHRYSGSSFTFAINYHHSTGADFAASFNLPHILNRDLTVNHAEIRFPLFFNAGFAYPVGDHLKILFDYHYRPWHLVKIKTGPDFEPFARRSLSSFHIGVEYIPDWLNHSWPLRFGFQSIPRMTGKRTSERIVSYGFSFGSSYSGEWIDMNFSFLYNPWQVNRNPYVFDDGHALQHTTFAYRVWLLNIDFGLRLQSGKEH